MNDSLPTITYNNILNLGLEYKLLPYQINLLLEYVELQIKQGVISRNRIISKIKSQLKKNVPLEYITGYSYFGNNKYIVKQAKCKTYIPAPKTLELVQKTFNFYNNLKETDKTILFLDIGTGSGAILLELMARILEHKLQNNTEFKKSNLNRTVFKRYVFIGTDINPCAVKIAQKNFKNIIRPIITNSNISIKSPKFVKANIVFNTSTSPEYSNDHLKIDSLILQAIQNADIIIITFNKPYIPVSYKKYLSKTMLFYPKQALFINEFTAKAWKRFLQLLHKYKKHKQIFIIQETSHNPRIKTAKIISYTL